MISAVLTFVILFGCIVYGADLYAWGDNRVGELAIGSYAAQVSTPALISIGSPAERVISFDFSGTNEAGERSSYFLTSEYVADTCISRIYVAGDVSYCGVVSSVSDVPILVQTFNSICLVSIATPRHSILLLDDSGNVYSYGFVGADNDILGRAGEFCPANFDDAKVDLITDIGLDVISGDTVALVVTESGVYSWGISSELSGDSLSMLGRGNSPTSVSIPTLIDTQYFDGPVLKCKCDLEVCGCSTMGNGNRLYLWGFGFSLLATQYVPSSETIPIGDKSIVDFCLAGQNHLVVVSDGVVWSFGVSWSSYLGRTGSGRPAAPVPSISGDSCLGVCNLLNNKVRDVYVTFEEGGNSFGWGINGWPANKIPGFGDSGRTNPVDCPFFPPKKILAHPHSNTGCMHTAVIASDVSCDSYNQHIGGEGANDVCMECPIGTFSPFVSSQTCQSCPTKGLLKPIVCPSSNDNFLNELYWILAIFLATMVVAASTTLIPVSLFISLVYFRSPEKTKSDILRRVFQSKSEAATKIDPKDIAVSKQIGSGGFGAVYLARYKGMEVCVKKLHQSGDLNKDKKNVAAFGREVDILSKLDHKHVMKVYGSCLLNDQFAIIMEYCNGGTLKPSYQLKSLSKKDKVEIAGKVADALIYLHGKNIIHRDIKSENILLSVIGGVKEPKVADFGLARERVSESMTMAGTLAYVAPELLKDSHYDLKVDIYAFGMFLYAFFSNEEPWSNVNAMQIPGLVMKGQRPDLSGLPPEIGRLIDQCTKQNPKDRIELQQVKKQLKQCSGDKMSHSSPSVPPPIPRWHQRREF